MNKELKHYQIINSGQEIEKTRFRGIYSLVFSYILFSSSDSDAKVLAKV